MYALNAKIVYFHEKKGTRERRVWAFEKSLKEIA